MVSPCTTSQIDYYLDYISLPSRYRRNQNLPLDIDLLSALQACQLASIPYDNLSLHYTSERMISLDPQHLFNKFTQNGRGGYCMETSLFFNHVLRALGFKAYTAGVRIRLRKAGIPHGQYIGL